ncbi:Ldh family oxidoreductase [Paenibacillus thalictri]|uniref:Ldh family oxidoreductase n=1 Tax=Paenibacillus thalictri TaxID=2527873 RepID=A0A4Q9DIU4_9BACL|nr:Ldh family oxidoreductase [Paenibacillus thalictri]TBL73294.1 Ldh family oxidoreductase [Paenibacillus thalictri]
MSERQTSLFYRAAGLADFAKQVLVRLGMAEADAGIAADSLVRADLEGNESHGISRLPIYAKRMREGRIAAVPDMSFEQSGAVLRVDGGNGLGQVVAYRAMEKALPLARENGMTGIFVRGSNHFGTAAYFCQMACRENMALIAMTNSPPGIPPWGGKKAFFGTNPLAFGFPVRSGPPVIIDMSSSVVARGKIILAQKTGESIPKGWAMDEHGAETTDPAAALRGAVLPLGGAKGYALAMAVELMCSVLSGAAYGPHVNNLYKDGDPPAGVGHSFILLDIAKWMSMDNYFDIMERFLQEVKDTPKAAGADEIYYPGERRHKEYEKRSACGLAVAPEVAGELRLLGEAVGVVFPEGEYR